MEEPERFWWINERLTIYESEVRDDTIWLRDACKQTGNYFSSREEAEKAVEKLKAFKRLKDKGFMFKKWRTADISGDKYYFVIQAEANDADGADLDLLFSGEED